MSMDHPLICRLVDEFQYPTLSNLEQLEDINNAEVQLLFLPGNPKLYPEALDVAVILPELVNAFDGQFQPIVVSEEHEDAVKQRFKFSSWPALIFVKQGIMLGSICKVQDWADYLSLIRKLLNSSEQIKDVIPSVTQETTI